MNIRKYAVSIAVVFCVACLMGAGWGSYRNLSAGFLTVDSTSSLVGAVTTGGALSVGGNASVTGTSSLVGVVTTTSDLTVGGNAAVTGTSALTGNVAIAGNLATTGTTTLTGAVTTGGNLTVAGSVATTGAITGLASVVDYVDDATPRTITAAESGTVFTLGTDATAAVTFNLPAAAAGLQYTFIDLDVTAGVDLKIQAGTGDTINGGTAAKIYECTGDAVKQSVTIVAVDGVKWEVISELGTWANNNA